MGTDKAFIDVRGRPLVSYAIRALKGAGANRTVAVGARTAALVEMDIEVVADRFPSEGPLGGIVTAFEECTAPTIVILPCDIPGVDSSFVSSLLAVLDGSPDAVAAVPMVEGRRQVVTIALRREAGCVIARLFEDGERSVRAALDRLAVVEFSVDADVLVDLDRPEDLSRYAGSFLENGPEWTNDDCRSSGAPPGFP